LLDDQFKYVAGNMGAVQVIAGSSKQALVAPLQTIAKNGYLYIYVSNQSPQNVYFDDLVIKHYTGPLLQEQSYYPFGLEMAGISDQAMGKLDSKNKFNGGVELEEDYGVNLYSTFYRKYDPQIGRFSGVDILIEKSINVSVYQFAANNPLSLNDPLGDQFRYKDPQGNLWHHADVLEGTASEGQQYQEGYGVDGFGDDHYGGSGDGGGKYASYWNNLWQSVPDGQNRTFTDDPLLVDDPSRPYGYVNESGAYNSREYYGKVYDDPEVGKRFLLTTFNGLNLDGSWNDWDGAFMRTIVPDFVSIGVGFNGIAGIGGGSSVELQWVLHGPEASWKPAVTATQSIGAGYSVDATLNLGSARYSGRASDISRKMLATNTFGKGDFPTLWGSGGLSGFAKIGVTGSLTYTGSGDFIYGGQLNFGGGLPMGPVPINGAGGVSNTWTLYDFFDGK
jgi:RHS repeat-associated protein